MRFDATIIMGGGRENEATEKFGASYFLSFMDTDGNTFENVFAKKLAFPTGLPEAGTRLDVACICKRNGKGTLTIQIEGVIPADIAKRRRDALEKLNAAANST